jgi:multidrug transporter EmrE-like cation transporter
MDNKKTSIKSILLVILFTFVVTIAQLLMKKGAIINFFNIYILLGLVFYGLATLIFIVALKGGELSVLYPIISLGFVWVAITSFIFFNELFTYNKIIGITMIIVGVSILGVKR